MCKSQANTPSDQFQMLWPFGTDQASTCGGMSYWVFLNDNSKNLFEAFIAFKEPEGYGKYTARLC